MKNWIKNIIKEVILDIKDDIKELIVEVPNHYVLSKEHPNVLYIHVGKLPKAKVEEYMKMLLKSFKETYPDYKFILLPMGS